MVILTNGLEYAAREARYRHSSRTMEQGGATDPTVAGRNNRDRVFVRASFLIRVANLPAFK